MTLKVIGAGFGRTGTLSTYTALNQLGYPCYHMIEVIQGRANKSHVDFWLKIVNSEPGAQHNWDEVFSRYTAAVDNPACCVWRELVAAYPEAKVLLTIHPKGADAWYESTMSTIYRFGHMWQVSVLSLFVPRLKKLNRMTERLVWQRAHRGAMNDRTQAIQHYHAHIEEVKKLVPADRLLIYSVDEGWEPLCRFLGVPVPSSRFPNVNDRAEMKRNIRTLQIVGSSVAALAVLAAAAVAFELFRLFG